METLGKIFAFLIVLFSAFLVSLLQTHVILSLSELYKLSFITQFSFVQVFGLLLIFGIAKFKIDSSKSEDKPYSEKLKDGIVNVITGAIMLLILWGLSTVMYYLIA